MPDLRVLRLADKNDEALRDVYAARQGLSALWPGFYFEGKGGGLMKIDTISTGDCIEYLKTLDDKCVNCCVTSPPYYGLRDYGVDGQIGLEESPQAFVSKLVEVFAEVRRVLRDDGTLWLNLGDSYYGSGKGQTANGCNDPKVSKTKGMKLPLNRGNLLKPKDMIGIPWRVAFALQDGGWYLRQDIIWHKPNPMPESVTDRCTKSHEYIFLLSKSKQYYYDHEAVKEDCSKANIDDFKNRKTMDNKSGDSITTYKKVRPDLCRTRNDYMPKDFKRNKRSVWTVNTRGYKEAHFATYPPKLIEPCILAGCPKGGIVLDPFMGAGTTAMVAAGLGRHYVGCELNPDSAKLANDRIFGPLFS